MNLSQIGRSERYGLDNYGRMIGKVLLSGRAMLNKKLVKAWLVWWYCNYSADQSLAELEIKAREGDRGLWPDPKSISPWVFRKRQRG